MFCLQLQIICKRLRGAEGDLQIVAAGVGVHIQHFARKVQAQRLLALHRLRVHLADGHTAAGDDRMGQIAPGVNGHPPVLA